MNSCDDSQLFFIFGAARLQRKYIGNIFFLLSPPFILRRFSPSSLRGCYHAPNQSMSRLSVAPLLIYSPGYILIALPVNHFWCFLSRELRLVSVPFPFPSVNSRHGPSKNFLPVWNFLSLGFKRVKAGLAISFLCAFLKRLFLFVQRVSRIVAYDPKVHLYVIACAVLSSLSAAVGRLPPASGDALKGAKAARRKALPCKYLKRPLSSPSTEARASSTHHRT